MRQLVPVLLLLALVACGASARERTITAAFATTNASRDAFVAFDASHQHQLVERATSLDDGKALLSDYRAKRAVVVDLFAATYRAIAAAAIVADGRSMSALLAAAAQLAAAFDDLKKGSAP